MLVLIRYEGERIQVRFPDGKEVWITVCEVRNRKARVGIEAPCEAVISREELLIKRANTTQER